MRRLALLSAAAAVVVAFALRSGEESGYRVAAIFDTAKGMVAGQQVKIAGAPVGKVRAVRLTPDRRARMELTVDERFAPFHADASCRILPEGLISENYVECDPGTRGELRDGTVPVDRTAAPVSLQDFINVFRLPTNQRLRVLLDELGLATAGRGADLNAILRRANPALEQSRRVLTILGDQRAELGDALTQTDAVLASLADRDEDLRRFVERSATFAETTARHDGALAESVRRLPVMLRAMRPGLRSLDRAMTQTTPLLEPLRAAGPDLRSLSHTLPAFVRAGTPAVRAVGAAATRGRPALHALRPTIGFLRRAGRPLVPTARSLARLLVSTRDQGGIEGFLRVVYNFGTDGSLYDKTSHVLGFNLQGAPACVAADKAGQDMAGCSHKYSAPGHGTVPVNRTACGPTDSANLWNNARCGNSFSRFAARQKGQAPLSRVRRPAAARGGPARQKGQALSSRGAADPLPPIEVESPVALPSPDTVQDLLDFLLR